jgi:hypothetical protein
MKFPWPLRERAVNWDSTRVVDSRVLPGVKFEIARMSFGRRTELMTRVREIARRMDYLGAGEEAGGKMDAGLLRAEIDRVYVAWGLRAVRGLVVDGREAGPEALAESGPEELFREALALVRSQTGLSEEERKNS